MTDIAEWKERRDVSCYRVLAQETTDPCPASLPRVIDSELEADPRLHDEMEGPATAIVIEPGVIEFYGRTVLCLVRKLSEMGAALDMVKPCVVPDHFTLAFPLEGISYRCRLVWRKEAEMRVAFQ